MIYKAVFFDLDGTILNTLKDITEAVNFSLKKHGFFQKDEKTIQTYLGLGSNHLIKNAMDGKHLELFDVVYNDYKNYYLSHFDVYTKPYPNVFNFLAKIKQKGAKLALISNKPNDICTLLINKFYPDLFDVILGQTNKLKAKPNKEMMLSVIQKLNLNNSDVLYVGDSVIDLEFAKNSDVDCILVNYGFGYLENRKDINCKTINNINELEECL